MVVFTKEWTDWISHNIDAGCEKDGIFKILLDEGYSYDQIKGQMDYEPAGDVETIINPLKDTVETISEPKALNTNKLYLPNAFQLDSDKAELYLIENFLNAEECSRIIDLIKDMKRPSLMVNHQNKDSSFRTSSTCDLGQLNDPFIKEIDDRICKTMGIDPSYTEPLQGQFYEVGQEFKAHTDYFEADELGECDGGRGQRTYTFFINLDTVEDGGTTDFPELDFEHKAVMGTAIIWNNLYENGQGNYNTLHHGKPVLKGNKAIITKWFRSKGRGPMMTKTPNEKVPNYTKVGFEKFRLSDDLLKRIQRFYHDNIDDQDDEFVDGGFIEGKTSKKTPSSLLDLPEYLKKEVHDYLKPLMEDWSGTLLEPTYVYGIRTYHDTAVLKSHRDRLETHIISCIINIFQDVEEDWPLQIEDNYYRKHDVMMQAGEMIFYESARLDHGRENPLKGKAFANIFCHFMPVGYVPPQK